MSYLKPQIISRKQMRDFIEEIPAGLEYLHVTLNVRKSPKVAQPSKGNCGVLEDKLARRHRLKRKIRCS